VPMQLNLSPAGRSARAHLTGGFLRGLSA
jgi:hypothetical protein